MTTPDQYTYPPAQGGGGYPPAQGGGGWPTHSEWPQYYQPAEPPRRRRNGRVAASVGAGLAVLAIVGGGGFAAGWTLRPVADPQSQTAGGNSAPTLPFNPGTGSGSGSGGTGSQQQGGLGNGSGQQQNGSSGTGATDAQVAAVAAKVDPALVDIDTVLGAENGEAAGTGIVLTSDGVILTNNHVVAGATSITVTDLGNQKSYRAAVIGYDRSNDVAIVKLSGASGLATAPLASGAVKTGQAVVAIGNAGGTGGTPSAVGGSITALNQSITASDESSGSTEQLKGLIQVDADIQAGDSGGPLLNTSGQVIGMDTAASAGFQYQAAGGAGFAIPIATANSIGDQIRNGQSSSTIHLGATAYLGVEATSGQGVSGAAIEGVVQGTPAESAGLTRGDVITSVAGVSVGSATDLTTQMDRHHPGDKVKVTWTDIQGQSHSATVKLGTGPVG